MKLYQIKKIGEYHINHCEDALFSAKINDGILLIAVMDGCTMGIESHFASTLISKIFKKLSKEFYFKSFITKEEKSLKQILKEFTQGLFEELKLVQHQLALDQYELLSTLILGIINEHSREAELITIGDGLIACNGQLIIYDQDDQPDYLGYHLHKDFEEWFSLQEQRLSLENIQDLSISTDGIMSFIKYNNEEYSAMNEFEIIDLLLRDLQGNENENMLRNQLDDIEKECGLKAGDDLGIIRLVF